MQRSAKWVLREATFQERVKWNELLVKNPGGGSFLQGEEFARLKEANGWRPNYLVYERANERIVLLALTRFIFPLGWMWYIPRGPGMGEAAELVGLFAAIKQFIARHHLRVFLVTLEPELVATTVDRQQLIAAGFVSASFIQPSVATIILPLYVDADEGLLHLGRRARRYIRRAEKENIHIKRMALTDANLLTMYSLMQTAYGGRGIPGLRPYNHYKRFWRLYGDTGHGLLYLGFENDTPTVGVFVVVMGNKAVYKDGGSMTAREAKGTAYLIHWHIMKELARRGVEMYDLWGSPPADRLDDGNHPLWGIGNFKTAFSKQVTEYVGVLDGPVQPIQYQLWKKIVYPLIWRYYKWRRASFW